MVPGIGHIGAKHLIDGMGNAVDVFRLRKEIPERIPEVSQRVIEALSNNSLSLKRPFNKHTVSTVDFTTTLLSFLRKISW